MDFKLAGHSTSSRVGRVSSTRLKGTHFGLAALVTLLGSGCGSSSSGALGGGGAAGLEGAMTPGVGGALAPSGGRAGTIGSSGGATMVTNGGTGSASGGASSASGGTSNASGGARSTSGGTSNASGGARSASGGTSNASGGSASGGGGATSAKDPVIPSISGTCPVFATGTATIAGLSGISLQVGPKQAGTGSLLFYWHGTGSSASEVNSLIPAAARQEILSQGGIIVAFQGSLGTGGDCSGTGTFSKDDFNVADLIAACAVRDQGIDPRRIYTTGCSAGGLQAGCMGALRSSYIAATAPNSGGETTRLAIQDASRVPAVMTMHGGASDKVIVSFATTSAAYDTQMKAAGSFVINCNHGGGHCGAPADLQSAAWEFMKAHPFGVTPEPYSSALPATFPSYCQAF